MPETATPDSTINSTPRPAVRALDDPAELAWAARMIRVGLARKAAAGDGAGDAS